MHLMTTNPVSGVWYQNTRAGVIPAISFTRLSRRNARISAHAMRMRAYARISAHSMRMRAYARIFAHAMRMRAFCACDANARTCAHFPACDAMRCDANARMRCDANARIKGELMRVRYCRPLIRYVQLRVACVMHVSWCMPGSLTGGFLWSWRRGKNSPHFRCIRNQQFYVSGMRPVLGVGDNEHSWVRRYVAWVRGLHTHWENHQEGYDQLEILQDQ